MRYRWLWLPPLLFMLLVVTALLFLVATGPGTRLLLSQAAKRSPGRLEIGRVEGTLVGGLVLEKIDYRQEGTAFSVDRVSLKWRPLRLLLLTFDVKELAVEGVSYQQAATTLPETPSGPPSLPTLDLPVKIAIDQATVKNISIRKGAADPILLDTLFVSGRADPSGLSIESLRVGAPSYQVALSGTLRPRGETPIQAFVRWSMKKTEALSFQGEGEIKGDLQQLALSHQMTEPVQVSTRGIVRLSEASPFFDLQGRWRELQWPPGERATLQSEEGTFRLTGTAESYRFNIDAGLNGVNVPAGHLQIEGKGNQEGIELEPLRLATLGGALKAEGAISWAPAVRWKVSLKGDHLQPEAHWPEWKGDLSFRAESNGELTENGPKARAALSELKGTLRGYPVSGRIDLAVAEAHYRIGTFLLKTGSAEVAASGDVAADWNIGWKFNAPNLAALWPDAKGKVAASGTVRGPRDAPAGSLRLRGEGIGLKERQIKEVAVTASIDMQNRTESRLDFSAEGIRTGTQEIGRVVLKGKGTEHFHFLEADIRTPQERLALKVDGRLEEKVWKGTLQDAGVRSERFGRWTLRKPAALTVSIGDAEAGKQSAIKTEEICLTQASPQKGAAGHFCAEGGWEQLDQGVRWHARAEAQKVPLALFSLWLPPESALSGTLDGKGAVVQEQARLEAEATLTPSPGTFRYRPAVGEEMAIGYREGFFKADVKEGALRATGRLTLTGHGQIQAEIALSPFAPETGWGESRLEGKVDAELSQLGLLSAFTPVVEEVQGKIGVHLTLDGTPARPKLLGEAALDQGAAYIPSLGIHLRDLKVTVRSQGGDRLAVQGDARSGPGSLRVEGAVALDPQKGFPGRFSITGDRFQIVDTQEAKMVASPDLTLEIEKPKIRLTGDVLIPEAALSVKELPKGAVQVSEDVVLKDRNSSDADTGKKPEWEILTRVTIRLGEKVEFNGMGLTARIKGSLRATDEPGQVTLGEGQLQIVEGLYQAYGQKLEITQGLLLFAGPIDNPGLDIRAVRRVEEVTAGIQVRGTLKSPETTVFSSPPMDQGEALSYLLLGRPLNQASKSEGDLLTNAVSALGLKGGDFIAKKIGRRLGLDEVKVVSGESLEDAALVVGRYFSPRFYVSYSIGLFESTNTLHLRYKINRVFTLQGESGAESGMDLIYTKEYR